MHLAGHRLFIHCEFILRVKPNDQNPRVFIQYPGLHTKRYTVLSQEHASRRQLTYLVFCEQPVVSNPIRYPVHIRYATLCPFPSECIQPRSISHCISMPYIREMNHLLSSAKSQRKHLISATVVWYWYDQNDLSCSSCVCNVRFTVPKVVYDGWDERQR